MSETAGSQAWVPEPQDPCVQPRSSAAWLPTGVRGRLGFKICIHHSTWCSSWRLVAIIFYFFCLWVSMYVVCRHVCICVCVNECTCVIFQSSVSTIWNEAGSLAEPGTHDSTRLDKQLAPWIPFRPPIACRVSGVHVVVGVLNARPYTSVPNPPNHFLVLTYYFLNE